MKCSKCGFVLSINMRFAIKNNSCPACGEHLLSRDEDKELKAILTKVSKAFRNLKPETQHDVAVFTYGEIRNGIGQVFAERLITESVKPTDDEIANLRSEIESEIGIDELPDEDPDFVPRRISSALPYDEESYSEDDDYSELDDYNEYLDEEDDLDHFTPRGREDQVSFSSKDEARIKKLKKIARDQQVVKGGGPIRRIS